LALQRDIREKEGLKFACGGLSDDSMPPFRGEIRNDQPEPGNLELFVHAGFSYEPHTNPSSPQRLCERTQKHDDIFLKINHIYVHFMNLNRSYYEHTSKGLVN
jgi:hypothetical protein